jgi:hypothetical protein
VIFSRRQRDAVIFVTVMLTVYTANIAYVLAADTPSFGPPVAEKDLKGISGGADLSIAALSEQSGTVSNNSVNGNSVTGTISFDGQAFQNMNGLGVISANTGNNVSINSTMQVNIAIGATP